MAVSVRARPVPVRITSPITTVLSDATGKGQRGIKRMLHIDLCCGLGGWQAPFKEDTAWRSIGIDIRPDLDPDVVADVRQLPLSACEPTLVTASPPCTEFSTAWNAVKPLPLRNPDFSIWNGCVRAIMDMKPKYWAIENVAGLQHWLGKSHWSNHPWHLWGDFPPFDTEELRSKGETWNNRPEDTAKVPYPLANALKVAVEKWG